jgi:hypothetical protein
MMSDGPRIPYWHLWTDSDGVSRLTRCIMTEFRLQSMQPPADPQWQGVSEHGAVTVLFTVQPVGWVGAWHENPKPQWVIPLSGRWFVESMDGIRVEMGPGDVSFGGDQNCRERAGKRGHLSGTVGPEPATLMVVQFDGEAAPISPCGFS